MNQMDNIGRTLKLILLFFAFLSALFFTNFNVRAEVNEAALADTENNGIAMLSTSVKGDLDGDGTLTYFDLSILQRYLAGSKELSAQQLSIADINLNGVVDESDMYSLANMLSNTKFVYSNKVWNASEMPLGDIYGYDGLHIIQVDRSNKNKVKVAESNKKYGTMQFTKCIKTGGDASTNNYVPKYRALKFDIDKPCKMTIYASSGSTTASNPSLLVSRAGKPVKQLLLTSDGIRKEEVELLTSGTYYIYSSDESGSANIYYVEIKEMKGDLNSDNKITEADILLLQQYIADNAIFTENQKNQADVNGDGLVNSDDLNALDSILNSEIILSGGDITSISCTANVGRKNTFYLSVRNIISKSDHIYEVKYDPAIYKVLEIGLGAKEKTDLNIKISNDISVVSNNDGILEFKVKSTGKNWSGILTSVTFEAISSGSTDVEFGGKINYLN